jgi:hypothetical protein
VPFAIICASYAFVAIMVDVPLLLVVDVLVVSPPPFVPPAVAVVVVLVGVVCPVGIVRCHLPAAFASASQFRWPNSPKSRWLRLSPLAILSIFERGRRKLFKWLISFGILHARIPGICSVYN